MSRLLLDAMCGGIVAHLRMCGHDTVYALDRGVEADDRLLTIAREEGRTLVTRDVELAARADRSLLLRSRDTLDQLRELRDAGLALALDERPARCGRCNGPVERLPDGAAPPEYVPDGQTPVWRCRECGQHFWKGSHWRRVEEQLAGL